MEGSWVLWSQKLHTFERMYHVTFIPTFTIMKSPMSPMSPDVLCHSSWKKKDYFVSRTWRLTCAQWMNFYNSSEVDHYNLFTFNPSVNLWRIWWNCKKSCIVCAVASWDEMNVKMQGGAVESKDTFDEALGVHSKRSERDPSKEKKRLLKI